MGLITRLILIFGLLLGVSRGSRDGAPSSACNTLTPRHPGGSLQDSPPPYEIRTVAGQGRVKLTLGSPEGQAYGGFIMVARDAQTGDYVGEFVGIPEEAKAVECTPGTKVKIVVVVIAKDI